MKVVCLKENLKNPLIVAERILGKNPTLPILGNFLLNTERGDLKISSTDLEMGIHCWTTCKIEREGSVSVSGKLLTNLINNLPEEAKITLEKKDNSLVVLCGGQKTVLVGIDTDEFPIIPQPTKDTAQTIIPAQSLKEAFIQVINATATSDARVELQGVYINTNKEEIKIVATDSFRLAEKTIKNKEKNSTHSFIVPLKTANELTRLLEGKSELFIHTTKNQALFKTEGFELFSRLIEGSFPDYEQILPKQTETIIEVSKEELLLTLKTAGLFSGKANDIKLAVEANKKEMSISSADSDKGEYNSTTPAIIKGVSQRIGFNTRFLLDGLANIKSSAVIIELNGESAPTVLKGKEANDYFYLVMPIRSL